jgi:hypothetical protein
MNYLFGLFVIFLLVTPIITLNNPTFIISIVKGFMFGGLYNKDYFEDENLSVYTVQFCFVFITITMVWEKTHE